MRGNLAAGPDRRDARARVRDAAPLDPGQTPSPKDRRGHAHLRPPAPPSHRRRPRPRRPRAGRPGGDPALLGPEALPERAAHRASPCVLTRLGVTGRPAQFTGCPGAVPSRRRSSRSPASGSRREHDAEVAAPRGGCRRARLSRYRHGGLRAPGGGRGRRRRRSPRVPCSGRTPSAGYRAAPRKDARARSPRWSCWPPAGSGAEALAARATPSRRPWRDARPGQHRRRPTCTPRLRGRGRRA